jgi:hypothetical protein
MAMAHLKDADIYMEALKDHENLRSENRLQLQTWYFSCYLKFSRRRPTFLRYVLPPSSWRPDDGGSTYLSNVGRYSIKNPAVHPRRF